MAQRHSVTEFLQKAKVGIRACGNLLEATKLGLQNVKGAARGKRRGAVAWREQRHRNDFIGKPYYKLR